MAAAKEMPQWRRVALAVSGVRVLHRPSEDKISKIESGQTICQKGYSQKAIPPKLGKGIPPPPPCYGPFPPLGAGIHLAPRG